jgi:hypothetical protein
MVLEPEFIINEEPSLENLYSPQSIKGNKKVQKGIYDFQISPKRANQ